MSSRRPLFATALVNVALAATLAGCSNDPTENSAAACAAYDAFTQTVTDAKGALTSSATLGEIAEARDNVKASYGTLNDALATVASDRQATLQEAWASFDDAVSNLDPGLTVPDAVASLQDDIAKIDAAQASINEALVCN